MEPHIIGINTLFMIPQGVGGTEYHLRSFLTHLEEEDKQNSYIVFCNRENYSSFHFASPKWKKVLCPIHASIRPVRIIYEQGILPFLVKQYHCDVLHSFGYFGPIVCLAKHIITIHDVNWRDCPEDFSFFERIALSILIETNLFRCDKIMSVSEFTKQRLIHFFPTVKKKIEVIPSSVNGEFIEKFNKRLKHPVNQKPYILCVSALYPHKRIPYLLDLWEEIIKRDKKLFLVLIGQHGRDEEIVKQRVQQLPHIRYKKYVSLTQLASFYKFAEAFVFPSVYEGFGYPVHEALSVGKIVFVGNKKTYVKSLWKKMHELGFNIKKDATDILSKIET